MIMAERGLHLSPARSFLNMTHQKPYKIRRRLRAILGLAGFLLLLLTGCDGPPVPLRPAEPPDRPGREQPATGETRGAVTGYGSNPNGDIDQLAVKNDTGISYYHFPPHLARHVMEIAKKDSRVELRFGEGHRKKTTDPSPPKELVSLRSMDGKQEFDLRAVPPPPPKPGSVVMLEGKPTVGKSRGNLRFFLLDGKRVALSPRAAETLLPMIAVSSRVIVKGEQRDGNDGFVSEDGSVLVRARQLTIDSVNYIIE